MAPAGDMKYQLEKAHAKDYHCHNHNNHFPDHHNDRSNDHTHDYNHNRTPDIASFHIHPIF